MEKQIMPTYNVVIRAIITKTIQIEAENETDATEQAHEEFSPLNDGDESYEQDTLSCEEIK
jgi:hypothetical protein